MNKVSVKDIAKACGCSVGTVSKVLNNTDRVGAETAERIRKAVEEMGYRSSFSAHSLAKKGRKIGIVLFENPVEVRELFEKGFEEAMDLYCEFGIEYEYLFFSESDNIDFNRIRDEYSAFIITPSFMGGDTYAVLNEIAKEKPVVFLQSCPKEPVVCLCNVTVDAYSVGRMAAEYLSICSRKKETAIIAGFEKAWIHARNILGFKDVAQSEGLEVIDIVDCEDDMKKAYMVADKLLKEHPELGSFFVTSYVSPAVSNAVKDNNSSAKIVGVDVFSDSATLLRNSRINALVFQNQKQQAIKATEAVISAFRGLPTESTIWVKPELVMKSNVDLYEEKEE